MRITAGSVARPAGDDDFYALVAEAKRLDKKLMIKFGGKCFNLTP